MMISAASATMRLTDRIGLTTHAIRGTHFRISGFFACEPNHFNRKAHSRRSIDLIASAKRSAPVERTLEAWGLS